MRIQTILTISLGLAATVALVSATSSPEADVAKNQIQELVLASYVHGAFNEQDTATMRKGFHPKFKIHGVSEGALSEYPIDTWIQTIEKGKAKPDYKRQHWTHRFPMIDVTGDAAVVKVELMHDGKHVYTDYLSLLKLGDGWKITDKVYHRHPES